MREDGGACAITLRPRYICASWRKTYLVIVTSDVLACVGGGWRRVQRARVGADDDDVLKAGTERFERLDGIVVEEEQGAVEG